MPNPTDGYNRRLALDSPDGTRAAIAAANLTFDQSGNENDNLSFQSPHVQQPFVYASPPVEDQYISQYGSANSYSPLGSVTLSVKVPGTQITLGIFPVGQRVASVAFISNAGLLSVDTIAAITNNSTDGEVGVYVAKDVGPVIGLASSVDVYDGILAPNGKFCKRSGAAFGVDIAPLIKASTSVALYVVAYGTNLATSNIEISVILRYISLDG